jgi:DNA uptake protein ComE-like DNA-binding protein
MKNFITSVLVIIIALTLGTFVFASEIKDPAKTTETADENNAKTANVADKIRRININTATEDQLKAVLGVGDESAKKIIAGRPYTKKDQLKTRKIIHADDYEKIKKLIDAVC